MSADNPLSEITFAVAAGDPQLPDASQSAVLLGACAAFPLTWGVYNSGPAARAAFAETRMTEILEGHFALDAVRHPVAAVGAEVTTAGVLHLDITGVTGTSVPSADGTVKPLGDWPDVRVDVVVGGTVGTSGIMLDLSIDGGITKSRVALDSALAVEFAGKGIKIQLAAGDLNAGDVITGWTEPPMWSTAQLTAAFAEVLSTNAQFSLIGIAEPVLPAHFSTLTAILDACEAATPRRYAHLIASKRRQYQPAASSITALFANANPDTITRVGYTYGQTTSDPGSFPLALENGDTFIGSAQQAVPTTLTIAAYASELTLAGGTYAAGGVGDSVTVEVDVFGTIITTVVDLSATAGTQAAYVAALAAIVGLSVVADGSDIVLTTDAQGSDATATITAFGGAADVKLGLPALPAPLVALGASNVPNRFSVTAADFVAFTVAEGGILGSTFTANVDGSVTWITNNPGAAPAGVQWSASTGVAKVAGWDLSEYNGVSGTAGSFITDGLKPGMRVLVAGASTGGNNGVKVRLSTVTATVLTFTGNIALTGEGPTADVTISGYETDDDFAYNIASEWSTYHDVRISLTNMAIRASRPSDQAQPDQLTNGFLLSRCIAEPIQIVPGQRKVTPLGGGTVAAKLGGRIYEGARLVLLDAAKLPALATVPSRAVCLQTEADGRGPFFTEARTLFELGGSDSIRFLHMARIANEARIVVLAVQVNEILSGMPSAPGDPKRLSDKAISAIEGACRSALQKKLGAAISNARVEDPDGQLFAVDPATDLSTGIILCSMFLRTLFYPNGFATMLTIKAPGF